MTYHYEFLYFHIFQSKDLNVSLLVWLVVFWFSCLIFFKTGNYHVAQASLELQLPGLQPLEC